MKKKISASDCRTMFSDKLNALSMKDLGIELKHFAVGTAPECPSFLVNQDDLKKKIIEKFSNFFDESKSQGLEIIFLKSNYGNGKSHFIRTIYSFLNNFENVLAKKVSLKQERTDLKTRALEGVGQKIIKESASFLVDAAIEESKSDEKDAILLTLTENLSIDFSLAELLYQAARNEDISKQTQAIAILKGDYLPVYPKTFSLKKSDLNSDFYFNVIRLVCNYLSERDFYLVIVFDEYEHIFSWKDAQSRKTFFEDIKYFTDNIDTYKNLFFVFAESDSADNSSEVSDDPAYVSRKKSLTYSISDISSDAEIQRLYKMIKDRYDKYYELSFDDYNEEILAKVKDDPQVKTNSNYRNYTQVIMKVLDQYRNNPPKFKKVKKSVPDEKTSDVSPNNQQGESVSLSEKWKAATSISKKTILCDVLEFILNNNDEKIVNKSKKTGIYETQKNGMSKLYYIVATDNPSSTDFAKRYNDALRSREEGRADAVRMLYPYKMGLSDNLDYENVTFYQTDKVPAVLENIYTQAQTVESVDEYLHQFESGCQI